MTVVEQRVQGASLSDDQGSWEIARKAIYAELFSDGLEIFVMRFGAIIGEGDAVLNLWIVESSV